MKPSMFSPGNVITILLVRNIVCGKSTFVQLIDPDNNNISTQCGSNCGRKPIQ